MLTPGRLSGIVGRRPRRDDRDRAGRHPAARPQRRARAPRPVAAQHGRHRRADPGRRDLDRHPRHRRGRGRAVRAGRGARAGHRHRRAAPGRRPTRTPTCSTWPGSASARSACSPRSRSGSSRCSCSRRTSSRCAGTTRSRRTTSCTAAHHHVDMYWFPHTDRMLLKRNDRLDADLDEAEPLSRWRSWLDDDFLSNTLFGVLTARRQPGARGDPADEPGELAAAHRAHATATSRTGSSPRRDGWSSARWSTPSRARPGWRRCARPAPRDRRLRLADQLPGRGPGRARRRRAAVHGVPAGLAVPRLPHPPRDADHAAYFAAMEKVMLAHDGRPHWGKLHSLARRRPRAEVPAVRRLPRAAGPARPGPGVRQRPPAHASSATDPPNHFTPATSSGWARMTRTGVDPDGGFDGGTRQERSSRSSSPRVRRRCTGRRTSWSATSRWPRTWSRRR